MRIHLKKDEKVYINGAVLRVDRRTSLEFLNDVSFLLEAHVMQPEQANTPFRQLYFILQALLIAPEKASETRELYHQMAAAVQITTADEHICDCLDSINDKLGEGRVFDALRLLRSLFESEDRPSIMLRQKENYYDGCRIAR